MSHTACLVCFISTVNDCSNKKRKEEAYPWKAGASSGHITNLKQSILQTFDIYGLFSSDISLNRLINDTFCLSSGKC